MQRVPGTDWPARRPDGAWWREAVIYHVYLRSFRDSDGDGVGDLAGLIERLDYLEDGGERSLGVDAVWLSPVSPSANRDYGYDVVDYTAVDPAAGDLETFDALVDACHGRGIRVLLDFVLNHTSDLHPWFVESRASRAATRRAWYVWRDPSAGGEPPNNWQSVFGGPAWTFDEVTGQYYLHSYLPEQPDLNWRNPDVVAAMSEAMRFWLRRGVDGFRLDAIGRLVKDPDFADNPSNPEFRPGGGQPEWLSTSTYLVPDLVEPVRAIRRVLDEFPGRVGIGEVYASPARRALLYGPPLLDGLHLVFDFQLVRPEPVAPYTAWTARAIANAIATVERELPPGTQPAFAFGNHDVPRFVSRHDHDGAGEQRARAAVLLLLALRGTPCIYYGEEIGMRDVDRTSSDGGALDRVGRDGCRTPMQWDDTAGRGFTSATPWLPFGAAETNVADQDADPNSLLSLYQDALRVRRAEPALRRGALESLEEDGDTVAFTRTGEDGRPVRVALNCASTSMTLGVPAPFRSIRLATDAAVSLEGGRLRLPPFGAAWVVP